MQDQNTNSPKPSPAQPESPATPEPGTLPTDQTRRTPHEQPAQPTPPCEESLIKEFREVPWTEKEPTNRLYEVPHIDCRDMKNGIKGWRIAGASRRGKGHAHEGKYREDAWHAGVSRHKRWIIVAVADGGGSYPWARVGSDVAVKESVKCLSEELPEGDELRDSHIRGAMDQALTEACRALERKAREIASETGKPTTSRDLSTTLQVLAFCPDQRKLVIAQVGDGLMALQKDDLTHERLGAADVGAAAGETMFLNDIRHWRERILIYNLQSGLPRMIVSMTDGVADDVLDDEAKNLPMLFERLQQATGAQSPADAIGAWLAYEKRGSFDDRTLVVVYRDW